MSAPVIVGPADPVVGLRNGTFDDVNVRWAVPITTTAILYFPVYSSGNGTPYVRIRVSWGDGSVEETDLRPVGRPYSYIHEFSEIGNYNVLVEVFNSDFLPGGDAANFQNTHAGLTVPIRVEKVLQPNTTTGSANQWRGLALPPQTLQDTYNSVENPPIDRLVTSLVSPAAAGDRQVILTIPDFAIPGDAITITEVGRLMTNARILSVDQTVVVIDAGLSDDYTVGAVVEVQVSSPADRPRFLAVPAPAANWFFPSSQTHALVQSEIRMILSTRPFERVMQPEFGSELHKIPFEQSDTVTDSLIRRYTIEALQRYAPRAEVLNFKITRQDNDLSILMAARVRGDDQTFTVPFNLLA